MAATRSPDASDHRLRHRPRPRDVLGRRESSHFGRDLGFPAAPDCSNVFGADHLKKLTDLLG
jgi:hypothetical protein